MCVTLPGNYQPWATKLLLSECSKESSAATKYQHLIRFRAQCTLQILDDFIKSGCVTSFPFPLEYSLTLHQPTLLLWALFTANANVETKEQPLSSFRLLSAFPVQAGSCFPCLSNIPLGGYCPGLQRWQWMSLPDSWWYEQWHWVQGQGDGSCTVAVFLSQTRTTVWPSHCALLFCVVPFPEAVIFPKGLCHLLVSDSQNPEFLAESQTANWMALWPKQLAYSWPFSFLGSD